MYIYPAKIKKYPGNIFHALVNTDENSSLSKYMFGNMDHLAMLQGRPFWKFMSMTNDAILQT